MEELMSFMEGAAISASIISCVFVIKIYLRLTRDDPED